MESAVVFLCSRGWKFPHLFMDYKRFGLDSEMVCCLMDIWSERDIVVLRIGLSRIRWQKLQWNVHVSRAHTLAQCKLRVDGWWVVLSYTIANVFPLSNFIWWSSLVLGEVFEDDDAYVLPRSAAMMEVSIKILMCIYSHSLCVLSKKYFSDKFSWKK